MKPSFILEAYPQEILLKLKARKADAQKVQKIGANTKAVFEPLLLWKRQVLRISFKGGNTSLHQKIATTAQQWSRYANIKFDFGYNEQTDKFRAWRKNDRSHIRIGFESTGYWSFIGTQATDGELCLPGDITLNLDGFDKELPSDWRRLVLHEFGHALGFHHEHQTQALDCDFDFSMLYRYMKKHYGWSKSMVNDNLAQLSGNAYEFSSHDRGSIMHYAFPEHYYKSGKASPCYINGENYKLSATDKAMAARAYPGHRT